MWEFISERSDLIAYNALQHANLVLQAVLVATVVAVGIAVVVDRFRFLDPIANTISAIGLTIPSFALVGLLPCFWFWFQIPGVLGLIFSIVGLKATSGQARKGRGLAIAGTVVGSIAIAIAVLFTLYVYTSDDCVTNGLEVNCQFDPN